VITLQDILNVDGGRGYLEMRYPDAIDSFAKKNRKFKVREEKTPSASVYERDGIWYVTDFGEDSRRRNAVDVCMLEENVEFAEACRRVAAFYNLASAGNTTSRPSFDKWTAKPDEQEGAVTIQVKEFELHELRTLFSKYAWNALGQTDEARFKEGVAACTYLHYKPIDFYTYTKNGVTMKYTSNEHFPIFVIEEDGWQKIYKPKDKKEYRFFSKGNKPSDFLHGLDALEKFVAKKRADDETVIPDESDSEDLKEKKRVNKFKVDNLIICTGGSDALNVYALNRNYHVIWANSETATLSEYNFNKLKGFAWNIYNMPDIDDTGKREAHKLAYEYIEIKTIRLPEHLKLRRDHNGNPCKDVRDYLNFHNKYDFENLRKTAWSYDFVEVEAKISAKGIPVKKFGKLQYDYNFNNTLVYNFLRNCGFARFRSQSEGFFFIQIDGQVVRRVETFDIRDFIFDFLKKRHVSDDLRNVVYRSPQLNDVSLANLDWEEPDFVSYNQYGQHFFFQEYNDAKGRYDGEVWHVTSGGIEVSKTSDKFVWEEKVINKKIKVLPNFFEIKNDGNTWAVSVAERIPTVMKFLIQTCRMYWREELEERLGIVSRLTTKTEQKKYAKERNLSDDEFARIFNPLNVEDSDFEKKYREKFRFALDGYLLTDAELSEQRQHFANRIFVIGYLLHRYKNNSKPWGVWVMDNRLSAEGESHGGSGKSLLTEILLNMNLLVEPLNGRDAQLMANKHVFENVTKATDLVATDDCHDRFDFHSFYTPLTASMTINPKNVKGFKLPFEESPKFIFSSNFGDRATDSSSLRRKIYTVYSTYYHEANDEFERTVTPYDDLGGNLFRDFSEQDWEEYYNFLLQCLSFYLKHDERVKPPMGNVRKRNLIAEMTQGFKDWADGYFTLATGRLDRWYRKDFAFEDFKKDEGIKTMSATAWKKKLEVWCKYYKYELNPEGIGSATRKVTYTDNQGHEQTTSKEHVYIQLNDLQRASLEAADKRTEELTQPPFPKMAGDPNDIFDQQN
jgi:hypothetical protein